MNNISILVGSILILLSSCQQKNTSKKESNTNLDSAAVQEPVDPSPQQINLNHTIIHFWDDFNFQNDSLAVSPEYGEQHLVDFIHLFPSTNEENIATGLQSLFKKSSNKPHIQKYFEDLLRRYLYDVNSPFYNESYYIIVLKTFIDSDVITNDAKARYRILLKIANQNKVGDKATNFTFLSNGKMQSLYELKRDYIILFFYEPGCSSCKENINILRNNSQFDALLEYKATMLAIYPDGNKEIWKENDLNIPSSWTNGIDLDKVILKKRLYDLKASPTIYLLDNEKTVLLKDTNIYQLLEYFKTS